MTNTTRTELIAEQAADLESANTTPYSQIAGRRSDDSRRRAYRTPRLTGPCGWRKRTKPIRPYGRCPRLASAHRWQTPALRRRFRSSSRAACRTWQPTVSVMSENPDLAAQYEVQRFGERPEPAPRPQVDADLCKRPDETAGEYLRRYREAAISNERSR